MNEVYVVGHHNPDTDSIVSAISYAALRNALGDREYVAAHLDHISDETQRMLSHFGFEHPLKIRNVRTQVRDLDFDTPPALNASVTMDRAWNEIQEHKVGSIPVINEDGTLYGVLSDDNIDNYNMMTIHDSTVADIPLFNLLSVLEGRFVNESCEKDTISGEICIALPQDCESLLFSKKNSIVLCGSQPDMIQRALKIGVECVILCQTEIHKEWIQGAQDTCIISTPYDARQVARLIYQAIPISRHCQTEGILCFHMDDYIDDVREKMAENRVKSYPILDEHEKVVGMLSRYHLLRPRRKRVVLVDHNEMAQAVSGLDQAEVVAIIDHHRLADIQTAQPVRFRNEPVGSTTTIITELYQEHGVLPSPNLAGLMASAILSDTVMFKSPTCTKRDIAMAERLARIGNISLEDIGRELFATSTNESKSAEELVCTDFKEFHIAEQNFGVGQITCYDSAKLLERKQELLDVMQILLDENRYDFILLMLTDVLLEGTQLVYLGNDDIIRHAFSVEPRNNMAFLPGIMSRKKQIIPMLTALWG